MRNVVGKKISEVNAGPCGIVIEFQDGTTWHIQAVASIASAVHDVLTIAPSNGHSSNGHSGNGHSKVIANGNGNGNGNGRHLTAATEEESLYSRRASALISAAKRRRGVLRMKAVSNEFISSGLYKDMRSWGTNGYSVMAELQRKGVFEWIDRGAYKLVKN